MIVNHIRLHLLDIVIIWPAVIIVNHIRLCLLDIVTICPGVVIVKHIRLNVVLIVVNFLLESMKSQLRGLLRNECTK